MHPEVKRIREELRKSTPAEEKWGKLLNETKVHPRIGVLKRWVHFPDTFDADEQASMKTHLGFCDQCRLKQENIAPLLQEAS